MITIRTMRTATIMIPSVEPAPSPPAPVCDVGVAVGFSRKDDGRLSARLVNRTATPRMSQNVMRAILIIVFIVARMIFKYIIPQGIQAQK